MLQKRVKQVVLCAGVVLMAGAANAKICKTVGPDGSVVYTDRPVASCDTTSAQPTVASMTSPPPQSYANEPAVGTKRATESSSSSANGVEVSTQSMIETAVIGVLGLEDMVERTRAFCVKALPTSSRRYDAVADQWRQRNAARVAKSRRALAKTFVPQQQQLISDGVKTRNEQSIAQIVSAPKASQRRWCDQSAGEIEAHMLDPKDNLTSPLLAY